MAFYEPQGWQAPVRQASWEQPAPPSRSGTSSSSQREETNAFAIQFEEVDRAVDNLVKSGKFYSAPPRREAMPSSYGMYQPRGHSGRHSVGSYRSSNRNPTDGQNFYAQQRYGGRHSEADQMMQAKRRMAAQRERELRNYHQEQQYNRSVMADIASNKSDRSMSPSTLSEEGRRELIARQHRALYGAEGVPFNQHSHYGSETMNEQQSGNSGGGGGSNSNTTGMRNTSPRGVDPFGASGQMNNQSASGNEEKTTSPTGVQQIKAPSPSAPEEPTHSRTISKSTTAPITGSMGPIGSRPNAQNTAVQSLSKRTTSPLPNPNTFSFGQHDQANDRNVTMSSANNQKDNSTAPALGAWGAGSGVWGNKIGSSVWS